MKSAMKNTKRRRLEAAGWKVGTAREFLGLTADEAAYVEIKLNLARALRRARLGQGLSQSKLAARLGSSQSRVAKAEAGDPSVSLDLLARAILAAGRDRRGLARAISGR
jgi:ribosome-binding protein aMBF1 (putative translation factor)